MAYTETSAKKFLAKNEISPDNIRYILRRNNKTCFYMVDNRMISSLIPMNLFQKIFPKNEFTRINKSVIVCNRQVINVDKCTYLMTDGVSLEGRRHSAQSHSDFMRNMIKEQAAQNSGYEITILKNKLSILDNLPIPYCVVQLIFDVFGKCTSFIFRYCNKMMSLMDGQPMEKFIGYSFHEVFESFPEKKWIDALAEVSKNGGIKVLHVFNRRYGGFLYVACYRLVTGYCGCAFFPDGWANVLEKCDFKK